MPSKTCRDAWSPSACFQFERETGEVGVTKIKNVNIIVCVIVQGSCSAGGGWGSNGWWVPGSQAANAEKRLTTTLALFSLPGSNSENTFFISSPRFSDF